MGGERLGLPRREGRDRGRGGLVVRGGKSSGCGCGVVLAGRQAGSATIGSGSPYPTTLSLLNLRFPDGDGWGSITNSGAKRPPLQQAIHVSPPENPGVKLAGTSHGRERSDPPTANRCAIRHERPWYAVAGRDGRRGATCTRGREGGEAGRAATEAKRTPGARGRQDGGVPERSMGYGVFCISPQKPSFQQPTTNACDYFASCQ
jgi:hypothetical protein